MVDLQDIPEDDEEGFRYWIMQGARSAQFQLSYQDGLPVMELEVDPGWRVFIDGEQMESLIQQYKEIRPRYDSQRTSG